MMSWVEGSNQNRYLTEKSNAIHLNLSGKYLAELTAFSKNIIWVIFNTEIKMKVKPQLFSFIKFYPKDLARHQWSLMPKGIQDYNSFWFPTQCCSPIPQSPLILPKSFRSLKMFGCIIYRNKIQVGSYFKWMWVAQYKYY